MRITPAANPYASFAYPDAFPSERSTLVEWNYNPQHAVNNNNCTSGTYYVMRLRARIGGSVSKIYMGLQTLASTSTAATNATITGAANNGSGLIRITATAHGYSTNDVITIASVVGTTEANSAWVITVIDANNFDLVGSTFTNAYTSGGTATRSQNCIAMYDSTGAFLSCTGDMVSTWQSPGTAGNISMALAKNVTLIAGSDYYLQLLHVNTNTSCGFIRAAGATGSNIGQSGASLSFGTNGTTKTKQSNTITPGSIVTTNLVSFWVGLGN